MYQPGGNKAVWIAIIILALLVSYILIKQDRYCSKRATKRNDLKVKKMVNAQFKKNLIATIQEQEVIEAAAAGPVVIIKENGAMVMESGSPDHITEFFGGKR